jgi:large subunit ribosomal protein L1
MWEADCGRLTTGEIMMAKDKTTADVKELKAEAETVDEIEEVRETEPEVELPDEAAGSTEETKTDQTASLEPTPIPEDESDTPIDATNPPEPVAKTIAKAGKHSAKAIREAEAEESRQEAKEHRAEAEAAAETEPKAPRRQMPNPIHQHGKKYRKAAELIDKDKAYALTEALELAKQTAVTKFDSSVELHINLGVDPRQADQMVRASVTLPHGTGKTIRIAVFADGDIAKAAKDAGADRVGSADLLADIEAGKLDFDLLIAPPAGMAALGKVAKILGPRGLMPNPKSGTVTPNVAEAVKAAKAGKVEFRIDKQAIIHQAIGKASFSAVDLEDNATTLLKAILQVKPSSAKGTYVRGLAVTTSMGPGIKLDSSAVISAISTGKK